jgi:hypothetical protein
MESRLDPLFSIVYSRLFLGGRRAYQDRRMALQTNECDMKKATICAD